MGADSGITYNVRFESDENTLLLEKQADLQKEMPGVRMSMATTIRHLVLKQLRKDGKTR